LLWLVALGLFVAPFLKDPASADPEGRDAATRSDLDLPFDEDVADFEAEYGLGLGAAVAERSAAWFGRDSAALRESGLVDVRRLDAGRRAYETHCIGCHGQTGNGAGPGAFFLDPRPRNFRRGIFKFTSTETFDRPLRRDLLGTITNGLAGSSMPGFRLLSEEIRSDLVEYVRWLAIRGEFEQLALDLAWDEEELPDFEEVREIVTERWDDTTLRPVYPATTEPPFDAASIARGREVYFDTAIANCASCHGDTGVGDGPSAGDFDDGWGYPIQPRDLTTGVYRAGETPADLYRSVATGINGTPMPAFVGSLAPEQIWDVVHFVMSLAEGR
jgi:mono/diheme cytochrome c family protein